MRDLINKLVAEAGLTEKQARDAIRVISEYAKGKFPLFAGAIDKLFEKYDKPPTEPDFMD